MQTHCKRGRAEFKDPLGCVFNGFGLNCTSSITFPGGSSGNGAKEVDVSEPGGIIQRTDGMNEARNKSNIIFRPSCH